MNYQDLYKMLVACYAIAPKTDIRYFLNGVHFKSMPTGCTVEATDGHRLVQFKSESIVQGGEVDVILDIKHVKLLIDKIKAMGYHKTDLNEVFITGITDNQIDFNLGSVETINGNYPDCERVIWKDAPTEVKEIGMDARYLADILKVTKPFISMKPQPVKLEFKDSNSSVRVTFNTNVDGLKSVLIIMPCRL
jgi:DNA polymerase III sliding clamp (beta) subunit (PCNA family)